MDIRILHFYPDLMSLYGSYANLSVLRRYLEALGNTVRIQTAVPEQDIDIASADFLFMGAGTERSQQAALDDFQRFGAAVRRAAASGTPMLFAGTAMELLGQSITDVNGNTRDGIGLDTFASVQKKRRIVGDVYGHTDLYPSAVVGYMNKCSIITGVTTPLLNKIQLGFGNEAEGGPEGVRCRNVIGSHLTGPVLVKNPSLLDWFVEQLYRYRGETLPAERPVFPYARDGYAVTAEQLRLRFTA